MKKKLLYLTSILLFSVASINAQNVYDFGGATVTGYTNLTTVAVLNGLYGPGVTTNGVLAATVPGQASVNNVYPTTFTVGKLTFIPGGSARLRTDNTAITRYDAGLGVVPTYTTTPDYNGRLWANGTGNGTTKYTFKFSLTAGDELTLLVSSDATSGSTQGTYNIIAPTPANSSVTALNLGAAYVIHITAATTGDYFFYDSTSKMGVYRIYEANVTNAVLGTQTFKEAYNVGIYSNGNQVFLSNVKEDTQVEAYSMSGALVKSIKIATDTSFDLNAGIYVVKATSAEGTKSVKVIVQ